MDSCDVLIIGAGASGMAAGVFCARAGKKVILLEKEAVAGRKILVSGNGRCNFTNAQAAPAKYYGATALVKAALDNFSTNDCLAFFEGLGMLYKEDGGRYFPVTNKATAVTETLQAALADNKAEIKFKTLAVTIKRTGKNYTVLTEDAQQYAAPNIILACGSCAYPQVGGGDFGYNLATQLGHTIKPLRPALCALNIQEKALGRLLGLKVWAKISLLQNNKVIDGEEGEIVFNAQGISGNNVLSLSRNCTPGSRILVDFLPQFDEPQFKAFIAARTAKMQRRKVKDFFSGMLAEPVANLLIDFLGIKKSSLVSELKADNFDRIIKTIKAWPLTVGTQRGWKEASAAAGGVNTAEIGLNFESNLARGAYITGELLDIDGRCGGFNLHFAWAGAYCAAKSIK